MQVNFLSTIRIPLENDVQYLIVLKCSHSYCVTEQLESYLSDRIIILSDFLCQSGTFFYQNSANIITSIIQTKNIIFGSRNFRLQPFYDFPVQICISVPIINTATFIIFNVLLCIFRHKRCANKGSIFISLFPIKLIISEFLKGFGIRIT